VANDPSGALAGFAALGADRSGNAGFVVGAAAIPASGSLLGADHDFGDYAVLTGRAALAVSWQRFVGTALGAVVGAIAASYFEPHALVFACSVLFLGLICGLLRIGSSLLSFWRYYAGDRDCRTRGTPPPSQPLDLPTVIDAIPARVVSALPDGCLKFVDQGWREYAGRSLDESTGSGWRAVLRPADISKFVKEWNAARCGGQSPP